MKNLKLAALLLFCGLFAASCSQGFASGVGYIDYQKVQAAYPLAQQAVKEVDAKALELQQYMVDKEKQYKSLDTPLKKQNFEEATSREFNAKQVMSANMLFCPEIRNAVRRLLNILTMPDLWLTGGSILHIPVI